MSADQSNVLTALKLAVDMLVVHEPGDSRAVSDEFVALASVSVGDDSPDVMAIIHEAIQRTKIAARAAIEETKGASPKG